MNNDNIITRSNGQQYEYDADFDVYRRVADMGDTTHMQRFGWIYLIIVMIIAYGLYSLTPH